MIGRVAGRVQGAQCRLIVDAYYLAIMHLFDWQARVLTRPWHLAAADAIGRATRARDRLGAANVVGM